jgi:stage IV sporulation protein A
VNELKMLEKPFAILLNSAEPASEKAISLALQLEEGYGVPVALVNCLDLNAEDILHILGLVLQEFPVRELRMHLPGWVSALDAGHPLRAELAAAIRDCADGIRRIGQVREGSVALARCPLVRSVTVEQMNLGDGSADLAVALQEQLYYDVISELTGFSVSCEEELIGLLRELAGTKAKYDRVAEALQTVEEKGYGIVMPDVSDLHLEEPEIVRQTGGYGVRLRAGAQSIHMIRANIEAEISPIVGTEQQSEELMRYLLKEFEENPGKIWESNLFGKSLYELVNEGLHTKLEHMPEESREKLAQTLERIINEGSGGLICIIL